MNLLKFLSFEGEKALAAAMARDLIKSLPPTLMENRRHVLSANKITRALEQSLQAARELRKTGSMGFLRKSILTNQFKWELRNGGYPQDFVEMATESLLVELTRGASTRQS